MKKARTIAEFFILQWLEKNNMDTQYIKIELVTGHCARITDKNCDTMIVVYDEYTKSVYLGDDKATGETVQGKRP